jgi:hypothetical protein
MDNINKETLIDLIENCEGKAISIYMPMFIPAREAQQNPIRLKTLIKKVEKQLIDSQMGTREINTYLTPLNELINDEFFWQDKSDGLAIFLDSNDLRVNRLPQQVESLALVGDAFHITQMVPIYNGAGQFFLLSLAQNQPRLYRGSKYRLNRIAEIDLPESLQNMFDEFFEFHDHLNYHTKSTSPNPDLSGERDGMHFGQGGDNVDEKAEIRNFFHRFDEALLAYLGGQVTPLILSGVGFLHPLYKQANTYPYLLEEGITKNITHMPDEEIHQLAWGIVKNQFQKDVDQALGIYHKLENENGNTTDDVNTIVSGAHFKRIQSLFISNNAHVWGTFDPENNEVKIDDQSSPENQDLLSLAASHTIINNGNVLLVPQDKIPGKTPAAAILRF